MNNKINKPNKKINIDILSEMLDFVSSGVKKYGLIIFIFVIIWTGIKKAWYWFILPVMLFYVFDMIVKLTDKTWLTKISISHIAITWIFVFTVLKKIGNTLFEVRK
jgi:hypothetical protein